jgi:HTH-type transcriptional regulator, transcriptional repressor of NAD biosynthesis genes
MYENAVIAGKFYPFHNGHKGLIDKALSVADKVHVILVANESEEISPYVRALSIYETFSNQNVVVKIVDDLFTDDTTEISSTRWADMARLSLGFTPDVVVASEDYGRRWARELGCDFVMYDKERIEFPTSGTKVRASAYKQSEYLPAATKRYMLPRVVVLGAESTGTTTLANALGEHYNTVVVPEVGRLLEENARRAGGGGDLSWDDGQFWLTSRAQDALEERLAQEANGVLVCDTDSFATAVWYLYYMMKDSSVTGQELTNLTNAGIRQAHKHSLYILTMPDIPFVQDEYDSRTGESLRMWHTDRFKDYLDMLDTNGIPYITVSGSHEDRLADSVAAIDQVVDKVSEPVLQ